jgi:hypothetical protein
MNNIGKKTNSIFLDDQISEERDTFRSSGKQGNFLYSGAPLPIVAFKHREKKNH